MNIFAEITGIKYTKKFTFNPTQINYSNFDINLIPPTCVLSCDNNNFSYGISKWV